MENFNKLIDKAFEASARIQLRFDPEEVGEQWGIKLYPESDNDGHYYAYHDDLEQASRKILDEIRGFGTW